MNHFDELGFAKIDNHRHERRGFPEAVFCEGKTPERLKQVEEAEVFLRPMISGQLRVRHHG